MAMPVPPGKRPKFEHEDDDAFLASVKPDGVEDDDLQNHPAYEGEPDDGRTLEADPE